MKVGLILPGNIWFSPYVRIYTQIFEDLGIEYDIISWNRDGSDKKEGFQFELRFSNNSSRISKILPYINYIWYIKRIVIENNYSHLIVFGPQIGIFLNNFLSKRYNKRYIFDYRDLSIEQNVLLKYSFRSVLKNSFANVVSSPGFIQYLPDGFNYLLSHNFDIKKVEDAIKEQTNMTFNYDVVNILTIGGIRDYESNISVVDALRNNTNFKMYFVGKGLAANSIKEYVMKNNINNVEFEGYYPKEKESDYIRLSSMLNIFYPKIKSHSTALSNRFYNALIYKKPMIVTANSTQGNYVEQYGLGLSLDDCSDLDKKISKYLEELDYKEFIKRCNELLSLFVEDAMVLRSVVEKFVR